MELESSIKEAGNGLKSVRVTDRKKNAEIVKQFLTNSNAVPSLLSENTLKKRGYTWNNLFDDISDYIFKVFCNFYLYAVNIFFSVYKVHRFHSRCFTVHLLLNKKKYFSYF